MAVMCSFAISTDGEEWKENAEMISTVRMEKGKIMNDSIGTVIPSVGCHHRSANNYCEVYVKERE
jgi:hypothetical protein